MLEAVLEQEKHDLVMVDQIMYLLGNISGTNMEYRKMIR